MSRFRVEKDTLIKLKLGNASLLTGEQLIKVPQGNVIDIATLGKVQGHWKFEGYIYEGHLTQIHPPFSEYFSLDEFTKSQTAMKLRIDNTPPASAVANLSRLCRKVLDPLRTSLNRPVVITSGYRCPDLNDAVGGVGNSSHLTGKAADIHVPGMSISALFNFIKERFMYDELINEFDDWIHVSYSDTNRKKAWKIS